VVPLSDHGWRLPQLLESLRISHGYGNYVRLMTQLRKTESLILDDWGMQPLDTAQRQDLMEVKRCRVQPVIDSFGVSP